ncbi:RnfABCDGE type electron transport complex subunit D [Parvimonas micra]|uniref:RnfABCDGE type electron transport complex subunit D n=1 Tax=Parvimonas micra TaxID=33033 RepID=UPI00040758B0
MDEKDLKVEVPSELEKGTDIDIKENEVVSENIEEVKEVATENVEETSTSEEIKKERPARERRERTPRESRERSERPVRERSSRVASDDVSTSSETVENSELGEEVKTERPVRERRERTLRESRERSERPVRERKSRVVSDEVSTSSEIVENSESGEEVKSERPVRERRERAPREPRERSERPARERRERSTETGDASEGRPTRERRERPARGGRNEEPQMKLFVGSSPHIRSEATVSTVMRDVVIALIPTLLAGIYFFGFRALLVTLVSVIFAVGSEYIYEKLTHRPITIKDYSAVITGMLLAFNVPVTIPYWMVALGSMFAIIIVKQLYGGLGMNFMNPALAARAALMASFPTAMANYVAPNSGISNLINSSTYSSLDATTFATPLSKGTQVNFLEAFIGVRGGCIGEVSTICLLIGAGYLLYRGVIQLRIPLVFISTTAVVLALTGTPIAKLPIQLLMGGLILGAFFMATDYVSAPVNRKAQIFFAIGCGIITALIRNFGNLPEGVSYSILFMNILTPLLEKYCVPKVFGEGRVKK